MATIEKWVAKRDGKILCEFERARDVLVWLRENGIQGAVLEKVRRKA